MAGPAWFQSLSSPRFHSHSFVAASLGLVHYQIRIREWGCNLRDGVNLHILCRPANRQLAVTQARA